VQKLIRRGFIRLRSLLAKELKSAKISKLVRSFDVGMKVNPLLSTSFSGTLRLLSERFTIKFSAQVTRCLILHVYKE